MWAMKPAVPALRTTLRRPALLISARVRYYSVVTDAPIPKKSKVWDSIEEAVKVVKSGDILLCGGEWFSHWLCCHLNGRRQGSDSVGFRKH